jgi:hypothetical protein
VQDQALLTDLNRKQVASNLNKQDMLKLNYGVGMGEIIGRDK